MIIRRWSAMATPEGARDCEEHFRSSVAPTLAGMAGYRGAYLLRRSVGDLVEITVLGKWDSTPSTRFVASRGRTPPGWSTSHGRSRCSCPMTPRRPITKSC